MTLHDALLRPLVHVVAGLEVPGPERHAMLVQGILGSGIALVTHGADPQAVADDVYGVLTRGLPR